MKKLFKFAFVAAIAAVAGYNVYKSQSVMNGMSEFALANVEALADGETINPGDPCYNNAIYDAEKPKAVKCGMPCTLEPLKIDIWQSTSWCIG